MPGYAPILILGAVTVGFAVSTAILSRLIGRPRPDPVKTSVYECGVPPIGSARERFPIKFYLVCMLFILFVVDAAFLYPWALIFRDLGFFGLLEMRVFLILICGGFVYTWKVAPIDRGVR